MSVIDMIEEERGLGEIVWYVARGMMVLRHMGGRPQDAPIELLEPDTDSYESQMEAARTRLRELDAMGGDAKEQMAAAALDRALTDERASDERGHQRMEKCRKVMREVVAWEPTHELGQAIREHIIGKLNLEIIRQKSSLGRATSVDRSEYEPQTYFDLCVRMAAGDLARAEQNRDAALARASECNTALERLHQDVQCPKDMRPVAWGGRQPFPLSEEEALRRDFITLCRTAPDKAADVYFAMRRKAKKATADDIR